MSKQFIQFKHHLDKFYDRRIIIQKSFDAINKTVHLCFISTMKQALYISRLVVHYTILSSIFHSIIFNLVSIVNRDDEFLIALKSALWTELIAMTQTIKFSTIKSNDVPLAQDTGELMFDKMSLIVL
jgi:hypothetical protein